MICFLRFRRATFDLTRGIVGSLRLNEALHALGVAGGLDQIRLAEAALPLGCLLGQDVALVRALALHFPGSGDLESLRGTPVGLHLHGYQLRRLTSAR